MGFTPRRPATFFAKSRADGIMSSRRRNPESGLTSRRRSLRSALSPCKDGPRRYREFPLSMSETMSQRPSSFLRRVSVNFPESLAPSAWLYPPRMYPMEFSTARPLLRPSAARGDRVDVRVRVDRALEGLRHHDHFGPEAWVARRLGPHRANCFSARHARDRLTAHG